MREKERPVAVANTGPLISAFQCSRFDLIERYFSTIHIPLSIMEELERHGVKHLAVALIAAGIIHVHQLTEQENKQAKELACQIALSLLARIKDAAHHPDFIGKQWYYFKGQNSKPKLFWWMN